MRTYTSSPSRILLPSNAIDSCPAWLPPPVANATGLGDCCKFFFILGERACLPMRCLPAAVSQSHGMAPLGFNGAACTNGTAAVPAVTVAIEAATLDVALPLERARGGGPLYFSVAECKKAHCFALQALIIRVKHTWCFRFLGCSDFCNSRRLRTSWSGCSRFWGWRRNSVTFSFRLCLVFWFLRLWCSLYLLAFVCFSFCLHSWVQGRQGCPWEQP